MLELIVYLVNQVEIMLWESNILIKFLVGKCTPQESEEINTWLLESDYNKQTLSYLKMTVNSEI